MLITLAHISAIFFWCAATFLCSAATLAGSKFKSVLLQRLHLYILLHPMREASAILDT